MVNTNLLTLTRPDLLELYFGPKPTLFATRIGHAEDAINDVGLRETLKIWVMRVEFPHKNWCCDALRCPQTMRTSFDDGCLHVTFREGKYMMGDVIWRLGGYCYEDTQAMYPLIIVHSAWAK